MRLNKAFALTGAFVLTAGLLLSGCGEQSPKQGESAEGGLHIILTNGDREGELFSIDDLCVYAPEGRLYLCNMQSLYQSVYGEQIWQHEAGDTSLESRLKDMALNRLVRIKTMSLLAVERGISLNDRQEELAKEAAKRYYNGLSSSSREEIGIDRETVLSCYRDLILADEVYRQIIEETDPEAGEAWGRSYRDAPEVDGLVCVSGVSDITPGDSVRVRVTDCAEQDLFGDLAEGENNE